MLTSLQSRRTGSVTPAPLAGATSVGAAGVGVEAFTVSVALRLAPSDAAIVADVVDDTVCVVIVNVRLVAPAGTVTLAGTTAALLLLDSATTAPAEGAALDNVTVPWDDVPPVTEAGLSDSDATVGPLDEPGVTVNTVPHVVFNSAQSFACAGEVTLVVPTENDALVAPAGTVTVAGTVAGLIDESCSVAPPGGAGWLIVTVAVAVPPAVTVAGDTARDVTHTLAMVLGFTVTVPLTVDEPYDAVIVTGVVTSTAEALKAKSPVVVPADTLRSAGSVIAGLLLVKLTSKWPSGAGAVRLT